MYPFQAHLSETADNLKPKEYLEATNKKRSTTYKEKVPYFNSKLLSSNKRGQRTTIFNVLKENNY